jgi:hypothetical protein
MTITIGILVVIVSCVLLAALQLSKTHREYARWHLDWVVTQILRANDYASLNSLRGSLLQWQMDYAATAQDHKLCQVAYNLIEAKVTGLNQQTEARA